MIAYDTDAYTSIADAQFQVWRQVKVRGSTHDLRIAAICVAYCFSACTET